MGYERYSRGDYQGGEDRQDYGRDYGSGRDYSYSSARDYQAAGQYRDRDETPYGQRDYGNSGYQRGQRSGGGSGGQYGQSQSRYGRDEDYRGSYAGDGHRFTDTGDRQDRYGANRGSGRDGHEQQRSSTRDRGSYGGQPQGYDYEERGFMSRAGDEVRSWFGDGEAERRREADARYDETSYNDRSHDDRDGDYHGWRRNQIAALDRDYDEYRQENRSKFENEFSSWRNTRQGQRSSLGKVEEHMDVVGSDGAHVGTVDKVRGDRILLTKSDADADGRHHSIPSRWIETVDSNVKLSKTAEEAKNHWRDEERNQAMFGDKSDDDAGRNSQGRDSQGRDSQGRMLNRSFSGTY